MDRAALWAIVHGSQRDRQTEWLRTKQHKHNISFCIYKIFYNKDKKQNILFLFFYSSFEGEFILTYCFFIETNTAFCNLFWSSKPWIPTLLSKMTSQAKRLTTGTDRGRTWVFSFQKFRLKSVNCVKVAQLCPTLWLHGVDSPWNSLGQNTGLGSLSLLQRIFPTQGLNPGLPHCRQILY